MFQSNLPLALGYATVKVRYDPYKIRNGAIIGIGGAFAQVGYTNIFERSWDGRLVETYLNDGTVVKGYKEKRELPGYNKFHEFYVHLSYGYDGSVMKIQEDGKLVIEAEKDIHEMAKIQPDQETDTQDVDEDEQARMRWFLQLFCSPDDRQRGVYSGNLLDCKIHQHEFLTKS